MRVYQERKKIQRFLSSRPILFFLMVLVLFLLVASFRMTLRAWQAYQARLELEKEYQELLAQKERLEGKIKTLENPEEREKEAKERFTITAPDEKVLVIVEPKTEEKDSITSPPYRRSEEFIKNIFQ